MYVHQRHIRIYMCIYICTHTKHTNDWLVECVISLEFRNNAVTQVDSIDVKPEEDEQEKKKIFFSSSFQFSESYNVEKKNNDGIFFFTFYNNY